MTAHVPAGRTRHAAGRTPHAAGRTTYLVLPVQTDLAGQLHIVSRRADVCLTLTDYRRDPLGWAHAGLVDAHTGRLRCLDAPPGVHRHLRECEPIRPPLVVCLPDEVAP